MKKLLSIMLCFMLCGVCFASVSVGGQAGYAIKSSESNLNHKREIHGPDVRINADIQFADSLFEVDTGVRLIIGMYGRDSGFNGRLLTNQMNADLYALGGIRIPIGNVTSVFIKLGPFAGFSNWKIDTTETGKGGFMWGLRAGAGFAFDVGKTVSIEIAGGYDNYLYDGAYGWEFVDRRYMGSFDARLGVLVKV